MTTHRLDLGAAAETVTTICGGIGDHHLGAPTPCPAYTTGDLLDHVVTLSRAFTLAARKEPLPSDEVPEAAAANLDARWREILPGLLDDLAEAWRDPAAWEGEVTVAGVTMPGSTAAIVALNELVVHGWDLARATGQRYSPDDESVLACFSFAEASASEDGTPGLFGPRVRVLDDAPALDRLLGLTGRDPDWRP